MVDFKRFTKGKDAKPIDGPANTTPHQGEEMANEKDTKTTSIARLDERYPALVGGGAVAEAIRENLGGEELTAFDLERIKIPSGGGIAWEVPDGLGGVNPEKFVDGIIVYTKIGRAYYEKGYEESGGGSPPDCSSADGRTGVGKPGGDCRTCPMYQWGSDVDGKGEPSRGQACRQQRFVFLLREGQTLPTVLILPPTSLKPMKQFMLRISNKGKFYWTLVTRFTLKKTKNAGGIDYAQVQAEVVRELTEEESATVRAFHDKTVETFRSYTEAAGKPDDDDDLDVGDGLDGDEPGSDG